MQVYSLPQVHDFLVSVQGQDVFDCTHAQVVKLIREAGNSLNLAVERWGEKSWNNGEASKSILSLFQVRSIDIRGRT